jgi:hypothetical protein
MRQRLLAALLPVAVAACGGAVDPGDSSDPTDHAPAGTVDSAGLAAALAPYSVQSGLRDQQRLVVRDSAHWAALWAQLTAGVAGGAGRAPAPRVDFARSMVIVAAMGVRPTTGFSITIDSVYPSGGQLRARVRELAVDAGSCGRTPGPRAPTAGVLVPRHDGDVAFEELRAFVACY